MKFLNRLYRTKEWRPFDLAVFKLSCIALGVLLGAFFSEFALKFRGIILILFIATFVKTAHFYYFTKDE